MKALFLLMLICVSTFAATNQITSTNTADIKFGENDEVVIENNEFIWDNSIFKEPKQSLVLSNQFYLLHKKIRDQSRSNNRFIFGILRNYIPQDGSIIIDKDSAEYQFLHYNGFTFLVSTENIKPYLDGFSIELKIGNPYLSDFLNVQLHTMTWNEENLTTVKKTIKLQDKLLPGYWNQVEFKITPLKVEEFKRTSISISFESVLLREKAK